MYSALDRAHVNCSNMHIHTHTHSKHTHSKYIHTCITYIHTAKGNRLWIRRIHVLSTGSDGTGFCGLARRICFGRQNFSQVYSIPNMLQKIIKEQSFEKFARASAPGVCFRGCIFLKVYSRPNMLQKKAVEQSLQNFWMGVCVPRVPLRVCGIRSLGEWILCL